MSLFSNITENLQFVAPEFYKNRYFKKLKNLHYDNVLQRNVKPELLMVEIEQRHHSQTILEIIREIESWRYASFYLDRPSFELKPVTEDFLKKQQENEVKDKSNYINNIIFIPKK